MTDGPSGRPDGHGADRGHGAHGADRGHGGHLDADLLAEFRAGLIDGHRGRDIRAHLSGCPECAALDDRLAAVPALLAAVPATAIPPSIAARLDRALAAEPPLQSQRTSQLPSGHPESPAVVSLSRWRRVMMPAAAALVVVAGIGFGLSQLDGGSTTSGPSSGTAAGAAASTSGRPGQVAAAPQEGRANQAGNSSDSGGQTVGSGQTVAGGTGSLTVVRDDIKLSRSTLATQLSGQLRSLSALRGVPVAASSATAGCVRSVAGHVTPVLVETATFDGVPATVVVTRSGSGYHAAVAGPGCSATKSDVLASVALPVPASGISTP